MAKILLPNGEVIERKPLAKALGNFCQMYVRFKNKLYAIGDGDEYMRGTPDVFRLNYLAGGENPQYILYPEHKEEMEKRPSMKAYYKDYIELSC